MYTMDGEMEREISDTEIELFQILEKISMQVEFIDGVNDDCYDDIGRQELIDFIKTNPDATTGIIILQGMTIGQKREKQCSKILVKRGAKKQHD